MKTYIVLLFAIFACNAQTINIEAQDGTYIPGAYYKDTNNILGDFIGTFLYQNGNITFKLVLQKKMANAITNGGISFTEDLITGGYFYEGNGFQASSLDELSIAFLNARSYAIDGNIVLTGNVRGCSDCAGGEHRLLLSVVHGPSHSIGNIILRRKIIGGQPALEATIWWEGKVRSLDDEPTTAPFPGGVYMMIKQ